MSTNVCTFCGRMTANPEITMLPSGKERVRFSIAVDRNYKREDGTRPTDFISVVKWGSAEYFRKTNMGKGDKVIVVGRLENSEWTDLEGVQRRDRVVNCENIELVQKKQSKKDEAANAAAASQEQGTAPAYNEEDNFPF